MKTIIGITRQVGSMVQASILSGLLFSRDLEVPSKTSTLRILFYFRRGTDLEAGLFLTLFHRLSLTGDDRVFVTNLTQVFLRILPEI